jgi:SPP1 gp7 family putative phage head morphogenesis protein
MAKATKHRQWSAPRRIEEAFQRHLYEFLKAPTDQFAERIAREMVTAARVNTARGWRGAAAESTKSRLIHRLLRNELNGPVGIEVDRLIQHNALLIRTLPDSIAARTSAWISEQQIRGRRSEALQEELEAQLKHLTSVEVRRIARTETAKSEAAITQSRAQAIGIQWAQWLTSEDGRVRKSHRKMDKVLFRFDDLPNPEQLCGMKSDAGRYGPGGVWNCRCSTAPLVDLNEISWPVRVYHGGKLQRMSRKQFERLAA